ncbi:MAG: pyridoxal phosphate-dependent aminotransferase [Rhodospirillales bacterium]
MRFSGLVNRIGGETAGAWDIFYAANEAEQQGRDIINLSIGDPDLNAPDAVVERAVEALRAGDAHYAAVDGRLGLREAVAKKHTAVSGVSYGPENVRIYAGAQNALFASALCLFEAGDEIIVPEPCYVTYEATIGASGAVWVRAPQPAETGFRPDPDAIARAVTPRTKALFITTPNNPTGVVMTKEELSAIAETARRHDLWVLSDEVYGDLTFERPHVSIAGLPGMAERTVTASSLSKSHAMTGWRIGWAVGPETLMAHMSNLSLCMLYGLPGFIQEAAVLALEQGEAAVSVVRETFRRRRDLVLKRLSGAPGLRLIAPEAGMFLMIDVRGTGLSAHDFSWALFRETGVAVLNTAPFGPSAEGCVRVSFASSDEKLEEAARRIENFLRARNTA